MIQCVTTVAQWYRANIETIAWRIFFVPIVVTDNLHTILYAVVDVVANIEQLILHYFSAKDVIEKY